MPNTKWSMLSKLQLGHYAEYYAKMEFSSFGFDVYTSEVDDHGVDFVVRDPVDGRYYEIQVKSCRGLQYIFVRKDKMVIDQSRVVVLLIFTDGKLPDLYIIPSSAWENPNSLFADRNYDKEGQISQPEWGINLSRKNLPLLAKYKEESVFKMTGQRFTLHNLDHLLK